MNTEMTIEEVFKKERRGPKGGCSNGIAV